MYKTTLFSILNDHGKIYHLLNSANGDNTKALAQPSESYTKDMAGGLEPGDL